MVSLPILLTCHRIDCIGMHQNAKGAPVDHQPRDKRPELGRCEKVNFEHGNWMWADGFFPESVDPEFREFSPNPLPQLSRKLLLIGILLEMVDMHVEAASPPIIQRLNELLITLAQDTCPGIDVALAIFRYLVGQWGSVLVAG